MPERIKTVFLSSTGRDLHEYREVVAAAINALDGFKVVRMEDFGARDWAADEFCRRKVGECDVYVGLIGLLYGAVPQGEARSFTEREYDAAEARGVPRLVFVSAEDFPVPGTLLREAAASYEKVESFRSRVKKDRVVGSFGAGAEAAQGLGRKVTAALFHLVLELEARAASGVSAPRAERPAPQLEEVASRYLRHLADRYRYMDFRGMGVNDRLPVRLPLLDLYVPLKARLALPEGDVWSEELRLAGRRMSKEEREAVGRVGAPQPVLEILRERTGLILLGDPGAGKSTFLKYLALSLAEGKGADLGLGDRIPFLVPLAAYAEKLAEEDVRLDHFIAQHFADRAGDLPLDALLASTLQVGRALLLLDGLDEVRERSLQRTVVERVQDFFAFHRGAGNKFVLTSRIVGYREVRPMADGLVEGTLVDFDADQIGAFLDRWVRVQEGAALGETSAAKESVERERRELQEAIERNPAVRSLAANPLLLTILALMKRQGVTLPEQRAKLYNAYIKTLLETWNAVRSLSGRSTFERSAAELLRILAPLALWIHETSPGVGLVRRRDLRQKLEAIYRERGEADSEAAAEAFLKGVGHSCLLLERGNDQYGFIHLTFLEYLAGYALAKLEQHGAERLYEAVAERVDLPAWREVLLLAIGHLGGVEEREISAGNLLLELIDKRPGPRHEAVILAGQALADLGAGGVWPEVRDKVVAALLAAMRDDTRVKPVQRARVGRTLAEVGDPRPEVMTIEGMRFCWVPPGVFLLGSRGKEDEAWNEERPQHQVDIPFGFWVGLYPVTTAQFRAYWEATGAPLGDPGCLRGDANAPVVLVSWHEAKGFCEWLTAMASEKGWLAGSWRVVLPSELEWEKAARGGLALPEGPVQAGWSGLGAAGPPASRKNLRISGRYPWGDEFEASRSNSRETQIARPSAVGCFPGGASPLGAQELSGNVLEWTRSLFQRYPYLRIPGRETAQVDEDASVVLRGGSFFFHSWFGRCAARNGDLPASRYDFIGFRVVVCPSQIYEPPVPVSPRA